MKISTDANFPMDAEGRVYHLAVRRGELANRIVQVGDAGRLRRFSALLDATPPPFELTSSRGFTVISGRYKGVPVSLVASGMVRFADSTSPLAKVEPIRLLELIRLVSRAHP